MFRLCNSNHQRKCLAKKNFIVCLFLRSFCLSTSSCCVSSLLLFFSLWCLWRCTLLFHLSHHYLSLAARLIDSVRFIQVPNWLIEWHQDLIDLSLLSMMPTLISREKYLVLLTIDILGIVFIGLALLFIITELLNVVYQVLKLSEIVLFVAARLRLGRLAYLI